MKNYFHIFMQPHFKPFFWLLPAFEFDMLVLHNLQIIERGVEQAENIYLQIH